MYKLVKDLLSGETKIVLRTTDNAFIPFDHANTDYQQYLKWLEEGNQPLSAEE